MDLLLVLNLITYYYDADDLFAQSCFDAFIKIVHGHNVSQFSRKLGPVYAAHNYKIDDSTRCLWTNVSIYMACKWLRTGCRPFPPPLRSTWKPFYDVFFTNFVCVWKRVINIGQSYFIHRKNAINFLLERTFISNFIDNDHIIVNISIPPFGSFITCEHLMIRKNEHFIATPFLAFDRF